MELSEGGTVATQLKNHEYEEDEEGEYIYEFSHVTTGVELTEGRHYWEVELIAGEMDSMFVGITRPNLNPAGRYIDSGCNDGWLICVSDGSLWGNGKQNDDIAGRYKQGDRVGVLLDLNNGSLLFFKNGVQHGPGYAAGSVTGPVVVAVEMDVIGHSVRFHANAAFPAGHAQ